MSIPSKSRRSSLCADALSWPLRSRVSTTARISWATREAIDRPHARPAHVIGLRPRTSAQCASGRDSPQSTPAPGPPAPRLDPREPRSARHGAGRRYGHAPAASCQGHRQAGRDPPIPAAPRAARTSPTARQPPNRRQPDVPLANPDGANRNAQRGTGPAPRLPHSSGLGPVTVQVPQCGTHVPAALDCPGELPAQSAAACVVHHRSDGRACCMQASAGAGMKGKAIVHTRRPSRASVALQ